MKTLHVALDARGYDILIERGILKQSAAYIEQVCRPERIMIVTDKTVESLYADKLLQALAGRKWAVKVISFSPGEASKTLDSIRVLYQEAFAFGMTRTDAVIALGGGVIGDLTGFFASTLFRGIPFVQIPTTLLAQVDSSVGGKTGVNVPEGKNLVGSFYQPKRVLIDPDTLQTLPDQDFYDGMAEVIKYGCIFNGQLFEQLADFRSRNEVESSLTEIIYACCDAKRRVVEADELDTGGRMLLNFGHTMGHVIEKAYHFTTYTHGQGVALGMVLAAQLGELYGVTPAGTKDRLTAVLKQYNLPTSTKLPAGWEQTLLLDKKMQEGMLHFVLLRKIGEAFTEKMQTATLVHDIKKIVAI